MDNKSLDLIIEEDYSKPRGHLYIGDSNALEFALGSDYYKLNSQSKGHLKEIAEGYKEGFAYIYDQVKNLAGAIKKYFTEKTSSKNPNKKESENISLNLGVQDIKSEDARHLLMDSLNKEVSTKVNEYFVQNMYEQDLVEKVKTAYDYSVKNSTLALSSQEVGNVLKEIANKKEQIQDSTLIKNYADNFVQNTMLDTIKKNSEIQGKYSIPRMYLGLVSNPIHSN